MLGVFLVCVIVFFVLLFNDMFKKRVLIHNQIVVSSTHTKLFSVKGKEITGWSQVGHVN